MTQTPPTADMFRQAMGRFATGVVVLTTVVGRHDQAAIHEATDRIMAAIAGLVGELRGEAPPPERLSRIVRSPRKRCSTISVEYFSTPCWSVHLRVCS